MSLLKKIRAKKIHYCDCCGWQITPRTAYLQFLVGKDDHNENVGTSFYKFHIHCWELWKKSGYHWNWIPPSSYRDYTLFREKLREQGFEEEHLVIPQQKG